MSKKVNRLFSARTIWLSALGLSVLALALSSSYVPPSSANHPVLVEGNCDSPVPGTTLVNSGTCGDYDGDTRIGAAEDTDGADRIFGTLTAALGPGSGAAAGTGANFNGRIIIVKSGRFSEGVNMANTMLHLVGNGHIQIEAAPGVEANIDAVLQGDPAGGNTARQAAIGMLISMNPGGSVTLRNLTIRNFAVGIKVMGATRLFMDNCRVDNNNDVGVHVVEQAQVTINNSQIIATGRRIPVVPTTFGHGLLIEQTGAVVISNSSIANSLGFGVLNSSTLPSTRFHLVLSNNQAGDSSGTALVAGNF
jgi:parallel beta helix pectate lyase-like protein